MKELIILVIFLMIVGCWLYTRSEAENFESSQQSKKKAPVDRISDYIDFMNQELSKPRQGIPPPSIEQLFVPSIQPFNPTVKGVHINNPAGVVKTSLMNAGMITPELAANAFRGGKGKAGFDHDAAVVRNSLELLPNQENERLQLAAATNSYVPEDGIPPNRLWVRKTVLEDLGQPGLSANMNVGPM